VIDDVDTGKRSAAGAPVVIPGNRKAGDAATAAPNATQHAHLSGEGKLQPFHPSLRAGLLVLRRTNSVAVATVKVQTFRWTTLSLGWYLSMVWGWVYAGDTARIWVGTSIRLFNVLSQKNEISLRSPRGAVDAVGDTIARRIGSLSFNSQTTMKEV
jgi:hypothetical protein